MGINTPTNPAQNEYLSRTNQLNNLADGEGVIPGIRRILGEGIEKTHKKFHSLFGSKGTTNTSCGGLQYTEKSK